MPNLFPDMTREAYKGSEDFIFAAPIRKESWIALQALCDVTPNNVCWLSLPSRASQRESSDKDESLDRTSIVLLRDRYHSDDDMLEAAAYLRVAKDLRDRIYAAPWHGSEMTLMNAMQRTIGAPRQLSVMFDVPEPKEKEE